jgi:hypothetical protein
MGSKRRILSGLLAGFLLGGTLLPARAATLDPQQVAYFEKNVRPVLAERCYKCHSVEQGKSKGGLTLDTRAGWQKGGEGGAVIVPGKPDDSVLMTAIGYTEATLRMPPAVAGGKLPEEQIAAIKHWIEMGASDPREGASSKLTGLTATARAHWAFQPVVKPAVPAMDAKRWGNNEIDAFVLADLKRAGLMPNPPASRESLIRRVTYDLIGLPPTVEEVNAFVADESPDAFTKVVDRLLKSPHYGERWARHWLDTARYSDTRGLAGDGGKYRFEDYRYQFAWTYRDYVIAAFNADKPYDQFVIEQLAADDLPDIKPNDGRLAALGFLTVGRKFENPNDTIDEQIDATTKAFLGLTVSCARCHDHKFDPIPSADYYSLHGVFNSIDETDDRPELAGSNSAADVADYQAKLAVLEKQNREIYYNLVAARMGQFMKEAQGRMMVHAYTIAYGFKSPQVFDVQKKYGIEYTQDIDSVISGQGDHPVFGPLNRMCYLQHAKPNDFAVNAPEALRKALAVKGVNPLVAQQLAELKPATLDDVCVAYAKLFTQRQAEISAYLAARRDVAAPATTQDAATVQLYNAIWPIPAAADIAHTEDLRAVLKKIQMKYDTAQAFVFPQINELGMTHPGAPGRAMIVRDVPHPKDSYVFVRGDPAKRGPVVPRQYLECLSQGNREPFTQGSGRYELAKLIASPDNPLTARVAVNRVWQGLFGDGFVRTPDDLGNMSEKPSHPELLNYLAAWFMENGWSVKKLNRMIVLSATYQQSASPMDNPLVIGKGKINPLTIDGDNRLLWRANLRRLDFESIRDSLLLFTGKMDPTIGGKPVNITEEPFSYRRSIYGYVDRLFLSDLPTQFDYADPNMPNSRRISTIVPQQGLFFLNNPLTVDVARNILARPQVADADGVPAKLMAIYRIIYQREPTSVEVEQATAFLDRVTPLAATPGRVKPRTPPRPQNKVGKESAIRNQGEMIERKPLTPYELLVQSLLCSNEFVYVN